MDPMLMTIMQIACYIALLIATVGILAPITPFADRSVAAAVALAAFVALGLSTPLREPPKNLSYLEWQVAKQKCTEAKLNVGPCRVTAPLIASSKIDPSYEP